MLALIHYEKEHGSEKYLIENGKEQVNPINFCMVQKLVSCFTCIKKGWF